MNMRTRLQARCILSSGCQHSGPGGDLADAEDFTAETFLPPHAAE